MAQTVEELVIAFSAETEKLSRDLKKIERTTDRAGRRSAKSTDKLKKSLDGVAVSAKKAGVQLAAAFGAARTIRGTKELLSAMNDLATAADGLGVSVEFIQELEYAFVSAGANAEKARDGIQSFEEKIGEARMGTGELIPMLEKYKISLRNSNGTLKTTEQMFDTVADSLSKMKDGADRATFGNKAFGGSWVDVVAVLNDGPEALAAVREEAREMGAVLGDDVVRGAAEADAALNKFLLTLKQKNTGKAVTLLQFLGFIEPSEIGKANKELNQLMDKIDKAKSRQKEYERGGYTEGVEREERAIKILTAELYAAKYAAEQLITPSEEVAVVIENVGEVAEVSSDRLKELRDNAKTMRGFLKEIGEADEDKALKDSLQFLEGTPEKWQDLEQYLDNNADSVYMLADAFETMAMDIQNADDHVRNLIKSFGRLIIQELALKAAKSVVSLGFGFADGGIMTGGGPMPLKGYSSGGIANSPQMAVFGEGTRPEAYVPLPDGRTIPVTIKGAAGGGGGGGTVIHQENTFTVDVAREVQAQLMAFAPMLIEAGKRANAAEMQGVRSG